MREQVLQNQEDLHEHKHYHGEECGCRHEHHDHGHHHEEECGCGHEHHHGLDIAHETGQFPEGAVKQVYILENL